MIIETAISLTTILNFTKVTSGILGIIGFFTGVLKVIGWVKAKLINIDSTVSDLKEIINTNITGLRSDIKDQTTTIAQELREQRSDFRTFYAPTLVHMQASMQSNALPVRAKRTVANKSKKKK